MLLIRKKDKYIGRPVFFSRKGGNQSCGSSYYCLLTSKNLQSVLINLKKYKFITSNKPLMVPNAFHAYLALSHRQSITIQLVSDH
ncbi:hypothetical protein XELAEV_18012428mg [Xenopus laevis]|uniref:Uncharacterized protein n=1 Tax=Xenopus laevis TaxID=8355 RepID=A0A974DMM5_XENLA|nr:hypothetical protein XELAEV_18012428mg [Xenopus laevis]